MKRLPLGIQTFSHIIRDDLLYIDKTGYIEMLRNYRYVFLSRPRRFGKSLLVSTLFEYFSGNTALFTGLNAGSSAGRKFPIIRLDFSAISKSGNDFESFLYSFLNGIAVENEIDLTDVAPENYFYFLVQRLSNKYASQVVILIDEYDKPIIDHIENPHIANRNRVILRDFFSVIKSLDEHIEFMFLTGVSKFSKVSIFSGLNQIVDITLHKNFVNICGITQEELESNFDEHLLSLRDSVGLERDELLAKVKDWYNGYSWDGISKVYNPFSVLNLFDSHLFTNFWFSSGTPSYLVKLITEKTSDIRQIQNQPALSESFNADDLSNINLNGLLFQTGYLTIKSAVTNKGEVYYILDFPNYEVKESLYRSLFSFMSSNSAESVAFNSMMLRNHLESGRIEEFIELLRSVFAQIPYQLHVNEEKYYHSLFIMIMYLSGIEIESEVSTNTGRIDGVIETERVIYILEFKYNLPPEEGLDQITRKKYTEKVILKGKKITLVGISFTRQGISYAVKGLN